MKGLFLPACLLIVAAVGLQASAQQPANENGGSADSTLTPEMWYYQQQLERYDDPKTAVRRNAEFRARQRMARLETMKWYGLSNARPMASPTPFTSMYSPTWLSNSRRPYAWYTWGRPTIVVAGRPSNR